MHCCSEPVIGKNSGRRFCQLSYNVFGPVIASFVGSALQRAHLDIHALLSRTSSIDHSSSGSIAPQSVKLAETHSFAISDMQAKQDSNS
jgi:hypothetical protein